MRAVPVRLFLRTLAPAALAALIVAAPAALADSAPPPVMDTVSFDVSAEDWVIAAAARVTVTVDAAVTALKDGGAAHQEMLAAATALAPDASWRVTRFDRSVDAAGLEHWRAAAEARVPEAGLSGLAAKAQAGSRPGLQIRIDQVAFDPTLAETETVRARLRTEIYRQVGAELASVNTAFPGRSFRVGDIAVTEAGETVPPPPGIAMRSLVASPAPAAEPALTVSQKLKLFAHVTLSARAP